MTGRRRLVAVPLVLAAALLGGGAATFLVRATAPADGTVVLISDRLPARLPTIDDVLSPDSKLRPGDVVLAVDGRALDERGHGPLPRRGEMVVYTVQRDGKRLRVPVRIGDWPVEEWLRRNWALGLLVVALLGVAVHVFLRRPRIPRPGHCWPPRRSPRSARRASSMGSQVVDLAAGVGLDLVVNAPPDLRDLPAAVEEAAWAIATEAMTNVVRHAGATQCAVALDIGAR